MKPLFLFAVILIQMLSVGNAQGCSCIMGSVRQNIKRSEVVMTGIITSKKQMILLDSTFSEDYPSVNSVLEYEFVLETAYKGGISRDTVAIYSRETSCAYNFKVGLKYVVYAHQSSRYTSNPGNSDPNVVWTHLCSGTKPFGKKEERLIKWYFWWRRLFRFVK